MAIDLTGIHNVNEFYTDHYLATYFEQSVTETLRAWRADAEASGGQTPYQRLRDAGKLYGRLYGRSRNTGRGHAAEDAVEMIAAYLESLGYPDSPQERIPLPSGEVLPLFREYLGGDGRPRVWVIAALPSGEEDLFSARPVALFDPNDSTVDAASQISVEEAVDALMLDVSSPARFVILASPEELALIDREKWGEKRYLAFDMDEIYRRREESTLQAVATLLAMPNLCARQGETLIDELDRQAHEHASEVSDSLRYSLRECVEMLGNEVIYDWVHNKGHDLDTDPIDAGELTIECLRYMYRMLFLLFMEARPELGFAPTKAESYQRSYSLESVRQIAESHREGIDADADDTDFIDRTLRLTCKLVYDGYPTNEQQYRRILNQESTRDVFVVPPLKAHIFDQQRTPLVDDARLRDSVMLQIIDRMSYTRPTGGRQAERVSYGTLGINQLGSVYEALLSYRGFIASERLYEVKRARDSFDPLDVGYFITEDELGLYAEDERVRHESGPQRGQLRTYEKGHFIYRLAGREREQSASYYTPESLTRCLVKYALKELLEGKTADEILHLTVCEPAMGSAAFLNEVINQLAEAYLSRKQEELGKTISHDSRQYELQRVKMLIADRNVYGIDLNPIAVELGEVSLWLNTISQDGYVPWFGNQLHCGNSLIGARRQGYTEKDLSSRARGIRWYDHEPERVGFKTGCSKSHRVYHFLVGDPGMSKYDDRVIRNLEPEKLKAIKRWNRAFVSPYGPAEVRSLRELSYEIDRLWAEQVKQQRLLRQNTVDRLECYGFEDTEGTSHTSIREKDALLSMFYRSEHARNAGPYARLKFAMDYWCSLWFWPIEKADLLPTRDEFLMHMSFILVGTTERVAGVKNQPSLQMTFDFGEGLQAAEQLEFSQMQNEFGSDKVVDLDGLCRKFPTLDLARQIAEQHHFFHWELEFADVFEARGGFDLVLGNPPWIKLEWNEKYVLSDKDPSFAVKDLNANQTAERRSAALEDHAARSNYLDAYVAMTGQKGFLNAVQNYPLLKGQQTNLYRCFLPQAWQFCSERGFSAFIHPDGILNDSKALALRRQLDPRLRTHFQFANELKVFAGVDHHTTFSLNVYGDARERCAFDSIWNLYDPQTIEECYAHDGSGPIPRVKTSDDSWETRGHAARIIHVGDEELKAFARLLGDNDWRGARIPSVHAQLLMEVLECMALQPHTLKDIEGELAYSECWHETNSIVRDHTLRNQIGFPECSAESVYGGSFLSVANPIAQTTRSNYKVNSNYDSVNLEAIADSYLVRTKYTRNVTREEWVNRLPKTSWGSSFDQEYRLANREFVGCTSERTLQGAILAPGQTWVNTIFGWCLPMSEVDMGKHQKTVPGYNLLSQMAGCYASLPYDFFVRSIGKGHVNYATTMQYPLVESVYDDEIRCRALLLNCLTRDYTALWEKCFAPSWNSFGWAKEDSRLPVSSFSGLTSEWCWETPLRTDYMRRQALVELDVLVSLALGLTLDQLITVYEIDFSVLQSYERETWYDINGRVACSKKAMGNFKFKPAEFKRKFGDIESCTTGVYRKTYVDDTLPGGPVERTIEYVAPFDKCNRVEDCRTAWAFFEDKYRLSKR